MRQPSEQKAVDIWSLVNSRLAGVDAHRASLVQDSPLVFLFGSRASDVNTPSSDVDLLVLAKEQSHWRGNGLDVVTVTDSILRDPRWVQGELATHIAQYGMQLRGDSPAFVNVKPNELAVTTKTKRVRAYLRALEHKWSRFDLAARTKYVHKLHHDLLRLGLLRRGVAVPPTSLLAATAERFSVDFSEELQKTSQQSQSAFIQDLHHRMKRIDSVPFAA